MRAGTAAMGALQVRQPGSSAAANGASAQAAAPAQRGAARDQHSIHDSPDVMQVSSAAGVIGNAVPGM